MFELIVLGLIFATVAAVTIVSSVAVIVVCQAILMVHKVENRHYE